MKKSAKRYIRLMIVFLLGNISFNTVYAQKADSSFMANIIVDSDGGKNAFFPIVSKEKAAASIRYDVSDFKGVIRAIGDLQNDINSVTGIRPKLLTKAVDESYEIIIGTLGSNKLIDNLALSGKLNIKDLKGKWESFVITTIDIPKKSGQKRLIIAGSDRRGTIYGIYELSKQLGVSPWYWWADVPVKKRETAYVLSGRYASGEPKVKYRGIFINDEDWGLKPWSSNNFEKDLKDIGPKTYAQVCELLLRLRGNMLAPAMHSVTGAFYSHPESKIVADDYGIIITTSHCEPLLFNNAAKSEWDTKRDGEWNYAKNKEVILKKMDDRVKEASPYENIYTMAMRGVHDEGLRGNLTNEEKVNVLTEVMTDQRKVLEKYLKKPITDIPQIFVPYKETMDVYELGLKVPEDITMVWVDDNYGYIKRLGNAEEQKRSGGAGVYYHTSYLGAPHDYLWLNTTPPVLMYEELKKAYDTGANKYWLINIGDIKPAELGMQTFFDFAWNVDKYDYASINHHQSKYLATIFGAKYENTLKDILDNYYRLAWSRKPEFMGWEREWDAPKYKEIANTAYSFQNYNDAEQRLADYERISGLANKIMNELPENSRPAFFELVAYPVMGSYQMNRKFLLAQLNNEQLKANNFAVANWAAEQSKTAFDSINDLNKTYNTLLNGKWDGMMMIAPGFVAKYQDMPKVVYTEGAESASVDLSPQKNKNNLTGCTVIDLKKFKNKISAKKHTLRIVEGIGYDGSVIQLGEATEETSDPKNSNGSRFEYEFTTENTDSVTVYVYSVPFWALHKEKSTQFGVSVDGQEAFVAKNDHKEFSDSWKDRVLQNGAVSVAKFPVSKNATKHTLSLICGDPGMMIQRVVVDWGGLKKSYVGPAVKCKE